MKRISNLFQNICSIENLYLAERIARRGKSKRDDIIEFDKTKDEQILALHHDLVNKTYRTSAYKTFKVWEPKERRVYWLPYRDQILHHSIMLQLGPMFDAMFTRDTYSCIKGRGIHAASYALRDNLKDIAGTQYCLKIDIKKFYPSVNHDVLKALLRRKIKDQDLLELVDEIIDSADGLPIGNYLSIYFGNFYLAYFDHWVKEQLGVKYYLRYTDDMVFLAGNKQQLHKLLGRIRFYLQTELKLTIKKNYQVFPVARSRWSNHGRPINFVGYLHYQQHTGLRPSIKHACARMMKSRPNRQSIASYMGWLKHCNSLNLQHKLIHGNNSQEIQRARPAVKAVGRENRDRANI